MSENENPLIEKNLDLSDGEDAAQVFVDVPPDLGNGQGYKYTVSLSKERMTKSVLEDTFSELWEEVQNAVLEDINKV
jgi:hypothetical protein